LYRLWSLLNGKRYSDRLTVAYLDARSITAGKGEIATSGINCAHCRQRQPFLKNMTSSQQLSDPFNVLRRFPNFLRRYDLPGVGEAVQGLLFLQ
jgi:hypothetical protein